MLQINSTIRSGKLWRWLVPIFLCAFCIFVFFRVQFETDFQIVFGDRTDGLIEITLLEHWWQFFRLHTAWNNTFFFFPVHDALGYNDGYFLYGIIYSQFRAGGIDQFLSSDLTNLVVKVIGFWGSFFLLLRVLKLPFLIGTLGATLFTLSNNTYANAYHAQLFSVAFAPVLAVLISEAVEAVRNSYNKGILLWGTLCAFLYGAWLITAFYTAWFTAYFGLFFLIALMAQTPRQEWQPCLGNVRATLPSLIVVAVVGFISLIPFLTVYPRKASETGMHPFPEVLQYSPSIFDLLNVGPHNLIFGSADARLSSRLGSSLQLGGEHVMGMPPGLIILAVVGAVISFTGISNSRVWRSIAITSLITWLFTVHIGRFCLWRIFYNYFPAAKAVRAISRYEIFLTLPIILLAMMALTRLASERRSPMRIAICLALSMFLVAEQINNAWPLGLQRPQEIGRLMAVQPIPKGCKAFYAIHSRSGPPLEPESVDEQYGNNVDAMFMAESLGIPTINGVGSFYPKGWDLTGYNAPDYLSRVRSYMAAKHISTLCALDLRTLRWSGGNG
jgi:hypothetical protein